MLVSWSGPHEPLRALFAYAFVGLGTLLLNLHWRQPLATTLSLWLLIGASGWGLWAWFGRLTPEWATVLMAEAVALLLVRAFPRARWLMPTDNQAKAWESVALAAAWGAAAGPGGIVVRGFPPGRWHMSSPRQALGSSSRLMPSRRGRRWLTLVGSWLLLAAVLLLGGWLRPDIRRTHAGRGLGSALFGLLLIAAGLFAA